jgi:peptidoglycan/xylan/chitin deacetylase (PgdA/CDA1 family)
MWRHWLKTHSASVLAATRLDRLVAGVTGVDRRPLVLGYHRVVPEYRPDPTVSLPSMDISASMLAAQLDWVGRRYDVVSLDELGRLTESGKRTRRPLAAITVDDGYRDAYEVAFPLFRRKGIPAAFFLVTDLVGSTEIPAYDRLYYQLARGFAREGTVARAVWAAVTAMGLAPSARRRLSESRKAYDALQLLLGVLSETQAHDLADFLEGDAPLPSSLSAHLRCLDWDMARTMLAGGMTIGSHTCRHTFLNLERPGVVEKETRCSRGRLEAQLGRPVLHFAYPAGRFDPPAVRAVAAAGYRYAYTACRHIVPSHPHLTIPRKILWEKACVDGTGAFSPSVMNAQVAGLYELVHPPCTLDHGLGSPSLLASAAS